MSLRLIMAAMLCMLAAGTAAAVDSSDDVLASASDAFGQAEGRESIGLYNPYYVRGFSPESAGNVRIDGLYFTPVASLSNHVAESYSIEVGPSAAQDPFPAPSGIADYHLREASQPKLSGSVEIFAGPYETRGVDVDVQFPALEGRLVVPIGATSQIGAGLPGYTSELRSIAAVPLWRISEALVVRGFWDVQQTSHIDPVPQFLTGGDYLPAAAALLVKPQVWDQGDVSNVNRGFTLNARPGSIWSLVAGIFESDSEKDRSYSDLYLSMMPNGTADHQITQEDNWKRQSTSGEIRLAWRPEPKRHPQSLEVSVRSSNTSTRFGDIDTFDLGESSPPFESSRALTEFASRPQTKERTNLRLVGIAYRQKWSRMQFAAGLQSAAYKQYLSPPNAAPVRHVSNTWLTYTSAKAELSARSSLFGSYTQGIEDSGIAPSTATNRGAILDAAKTRQVDLGFSYSQSPRTAVIAGLFGITKPYVNVDDQNVYRVLGQQEARGAELSISSELSRVWRIVAGAVLSRVQVRSTYMSTSSRLAFGQPDARAILNAFYSFPSQQGLSLDLGITYQGSALASQDGMLAVPASTTIDLGSRVRFRLLNSPAEFRIQLQNVTDNKGWAVGLNPGFFEAAPRRFLVYLTVHV